VRPKPAAVVILTALIASSVAGPGVRAGGDARYRARIERIDARTRRLMTGRSWRRGCPVPIRDLRLVSLRYWGFDRRPHHGELVVHRRWSDEIVRAFGRLYAARFPIRRMRLVDRYGGSDRRSMRADNTSAFNCRWRAGSPGVWSQHAFGRAIDIDPVENPYVAGDHVSPRAGRRYVDRSRRRGGMIHRHDAVVRAFHRVGWSWGGRWRSPVDYQHFSASGR
jgi:D-alanyl-D-alanine carboxypeptidase